MIKTLRTISVTISDYVNTVARHLCIWIIGALVALVLVTVFFRYVLSIGIGWSDELSRYLNIWAALLGASVAFKYGDHVGIEFFQNFLPDKALRIFRFLVNIVMLGALIFSEYYFYLFVLKSRTTSPAMQIPHSWIQVSLFVGFLIMIIHLISFIFADLDDFHSGNFSVSRERKILD